MSRRERGHHDDRLAVFGGERQRAPERERNPFDSRGIMGRMVQEMGDMDRGFERAVESHGGGGHRGGSMMDRMDTMMGGSMLGGMGGIDSMMGSMMGSMGGGGGGGGYSCSSSCCSYSSGGAGGQSVQYSSSSHGVQRPGEAAVQETHHNYRDSSGREKLGVERRIGDRGRSFVAERGTDGTERRVDNLVNVQEGSQFDREWQGNAAASSIANTRTTQRAQPRGALLDAGSVFGAPSAHAHAAPRAPRPQQTDSDRAAARQGAAAHAQQRDRMVAEARAARAQQHQQPSAPAAHGSRRALPQPASHSSHHASSYHGGGGGGRGGGADDAAYASRLAAQEARRAGLY